MAKASKLAEKSLDEAIDYINDWSLNLQRETIDEAKSIFDQLIWYISGHIETLRYMFSFTNFAQEKEKKHLEPFKPIIK